MTDKKRIAYIDLAKGIGMVLVLCGHLQNDTVFSFSTYIRNFCLWIFSFHMPLFFIISGMLFAAKGEIPDTKVFLKKRFSAIMIPYLLFSLFYFLIIIYGVFVSHSMELPDLFVQLWYAVCFYGINVLWFLPALFFAEMIFAFIMKRFDGKKRWIVMLLLTIAALCINEARAFLPKDAALWLRADEFIVTLIRPVIACSFISIGYLIQKRNVSCHKIKCIILLILLFAVNLAVVIFNSPVDLRSMVLNNYLLYYVGAVSGSGFIILLSYLLTLLWKSEKAFPLLRFFGRNSLVFMAVHNNPVIWIAALQCSMFVNQFITRARGYVSYAVIVTVFLVYVSVMIMLINRFAPILAGRKR